MSIDEVPTSERSDSAQRLSSPSDPASRRADLGIRRLSRWIRHVSPRRIAVTSSKFVRDSPAAVNATLGLAALGIIIGGGWLIAAAASAAVRYLTKVPSTGAARVVMEPVWRYLAEHSADLPASTSALKRTWVAFGVTSLVFAGFGVKGARVGWTIFGLLTTGMVWSATDAAARWTATGITLVWWSAFSIFAYQNKRRSDSDYPEEPSSQDSVRWIGDRGSGGGIRDRFGGISSEARGAALQRKMDSAISKAGYKSFGDFYRANCTRPLRGLSLMLDVPTWLVRDMKSETFPPGEGWRMERVPWQIQYEATRAHLCDGEKITALAERHGASASTVRRWIKVHRDAVLSEYAEDNSEQTKPSV